MVIQRGFDVGEDTRDLDAAYEAETIAIRLGPADDAGEAPGGPGGNNRRRAIAIGGIAVLAIAAVAGVLSIGGGSHKAAASTARQGSQIGDNPPDAQGVGALGQSTSGPGGQGGGAPASGSTTPGATGGTTSGNATSPTNPAQPTTAANPTKPGQPTTANAPTGAPPSTVAKQPSAPPTASTKTPAYAGRLASTATQSSSATTTTTVQTSATSSAGDTLLLSVMLTNTHSGAVSASDTAGNTYAVIADQSDNAGDRTLILAAPAAKPLTTGASVTLSFPATQERHVALDAFSNVTAVGAHSSATATSGPFASGPAATPGSSPAIVFAAAGIQGGENATWSAGFAKLPTLLVAPADQLATAYETVTPGSYQASGSCNHAWMAAVVDAGRMTRDSAPTPPPARTPPRSAAPAPYAGFPAAIHCSKTSVRSEGQAPSQGIDPCRNRDKIASECWLTSSCDHKSKTNFIDCRSIGRNKVLI